jgi:DNA-binding transcriptional ArsR family regulator
MVANVTLEMVFDALAAMPRQIILAALAAKTLCVNDIAALVDLPQPTVSYHLRALTMCNLVTSTRDGKNKLYSLSPEVVKHGDRLAIHGVVWVKLAAMGMKAGEEG